MYNNCRHRPPIIDEPEIIPPNNDNNNNINIVLNDIHHNEERKTLLQFIPKYTINKLNENIDYDCPICLKHQNDSDKSVMFICKHYYHKKCIIRWIRSGNNTCPVCKENLKLSIDNII